MALMIPIVAGMYLVLYLLLRWLQPRRPAEDISSEELADYLRRQREELGTWSAGQVNTFLAFAVAVVLWVTPGVLALGLEKGHPAAKFFETHVPEAVVALLAALLLFVLPTDLRRGRFTISWPEAVKIDWGTLLLFGGGLSLGTLMFETKVAQVLGDSITNMTGLSSLWSLTALAVALGILLSELSSNTAAANMLIPVVIALAQQARVDPVPPALGACLGASYGFMLPVSTPPNAIAYGTGLVPIPRMIRAGVLFDLCGFAVIVLGLRLLWPLL
jgi:sodium-dependent dicarboxylate transporter 2/3/5